MVNKRGLPLFFALLLVLVVCAVPACAASTTEVTVQKIADDGTTVLNETTVSAAWMEANLPVMGDGTTHYYAQGPSFNDSNLWDPSETINWEEKDMGAVRGTDIKDLCDQVGGAESGDLIVLRAADGYYKTFPYENVYTPASRQGPVVLAWEKDGNSVSDGSYTDGMRNVFFADTSTNPQGAHVYGNWDMHETMPQIYWHYFSGVYPATTGLSVQTISQIKILTDEPAPVAPVSIYDGTVSLDAGTFSWTDSNGATYNISWQTPHGALQAAGADGGFTYVAGWKDSKNTALLDNIFADDTWYNFSKDDGLGWNYQVNGAYVNYYSDVTGISNYGDLADGDVITYYYGPKDDTRIDNATALITIDVNFGSAAEVLYDGMVNLDAGTFSWTDSNGATYDIGWQTPHGALQAAAADGGFTYVGAWKDSKNTALLNDIFADDTWYNFSKDDGLGWNYQVNGAYFNYYSDVTGISSFADLADGDVITYYYGPKDDTTTDNATAIITIDVNFGGVAPTEIYDGTVVLNAGTFSWTDSNGATYDISWQTPHGALQAAAADGGFTYVGAWKDSKNTALLNDIFADDTWYNFSKDDGLGWNYQVNGAYVNYYSDVTGISNYADLADGDVVTYYYGPKDDTTIDNATVLITIDVNFGGAIPTEIYDGTVNLADDTFPWTDSNGATYDISWQTPHGALQAAAADGGFTYVGAWKDSKNTALLNGIFADDTWYNFSKDDGLGWNYQVNGVYFNYYSDVTGISNYADLADGDVVTYYYGPKDGTTIDNATAIITIDVNFGSGPTPGEDWSIVVINGDRTYTVDKAYFEAGVGCGHDASYTDVDGTWAGMPLYFLVGLVDDDNAHGSDAFNRDLAAQGYSVEVISGDGYSINFESADIADNANIFAANTLNGAELPAVIGDKDKPCWPLRMSGSEVSAGKLVGNIAIIELIGVPEPSEGWELAVNGLISDVVKEAEFNDFCKHGATWTDGNGDVWEGVPLWVIASVSDNYESTTHWTFDDTAAANGYTVRITAGDGFSRDFASADMARSDDYILASICNGVPLSSEGDKAPYPLRLVGPAVWNEDKGSFSGSAIGNITTIDLVELIPPEPAEGSYNLLTKGIITSVITEEFFDQALVCHHKQTWTNEETGEQWGGIPLWVLAGWVDDRTPHGSDGFNDAVALAGYTVIVTADDGYSKSLSSTLVARNNGLIVANTLNGSPLEDSFPLRLVGPALPEASYGVGNLAKIELTDFCEQEGSIPLTIVKYADDGVTELSNVTVTWEWMADNLPVYGDGVTEYKFEGLNFPPNDPWDMAETYPGGFKVSEQMKGTSIRDLCDLAGGMDSGTEIKFVATDGWTNKLSYDVIYEPADCVGEPVLAWYSTGWGGPMPDYSEGFRIFFATDDHIFGQKDMYEGIPFEYWHYNSGLPSCAGLSAKMVTRIELTTYADPTWNLVAIGAIPAELSKGYFEGAMGCTMSGNHKASYTDGSGNIWEGMPLWLICGFVDDANSHVGKSYNKTLAETGYDIHIIAEDGYETVIDSRDTIENNNYILANTLNGQLMRPDDGNGWPLRLVGPNVTARYNGVKSVRNVVKVILDLPYAPDLYSGAVTAEWGDIAAGAPVQAFIGGIAAGTGVMADTNVYASADAPFAVTGSQYIIGEPITFIVNGVEALEHPVFMGAQIEALDLTFPIGSLPVGVEDCNGVPPGVVAVGGNVTVDLTGGNVDVDGSNITIFPAGNGWESMLIKTSGVGGNATAATGSVTGVLATGVPVSGSVPAVGNVTAGFLVNLTGMPGDNASIKSTIAKEPSSRMLSYFQLAAAAEGVGIQDVAYTLNIQKSGITNGDDITSAVIRMAVTPGWVTAHGGVGAIQIIRHGEEGTTEVLETTFAGYDAEGLMIFVALSPNGLSLFGMAAVSTPVSGGGDSDATDWTPAPTLTPVPAEPVTGSAYTIVSSAVTFSTADGTKTVKVDRLVAEANNAVVVITGTDIQVRMPGGILHIMTAGATEDGNLITGDVTRVSYEAYPETASINGIGAVKGAVTIDFPGVPASASGITISLTGTVPAQVGNGLKQAALSAGKTAGDVAFIMPVSLTGVSDGSASVTLTAPVLWVESSGGADNVVIAGYRSDGTAVILPTRADDGAFTAESSVLYDGYALVAVSAADTGTDMTPAPTAIPENSASAEETPASGSIFTTLALLCAVFGVAGYAAMKKR